MIKWPGSEETSQTAFNIAFDTPDSYFDEIWKSASRGRKFMDAMSCFCMMPGFEASQVINAYNWASLGEAVVVDVGGSSGAIALEIVKAFPAIRAVVQDLPEVISIAQIANNNSVAERLTFEAHDFFSEQSIKGADVYFFHMILHDWSDKYCVRILRNLIPSLKQGARVLVNDFCLPDPGKVLKFRERYARSATEILGFSFGVTNHGLTGVTI